MTPDKAAMAGRPNQRTRDVDGGMSPSVACEAKSNISVGAMSEARAASMVTDSALSGRKPSAAPLIGAAQLAPSLQTGGAQ